MMVFKTPVSRSLLMACILLLSACSQAAAPGARNVTIPSPAMADQRPEAINEKPDSVLYLPLGSDVLVPTAMGQDSLPSEIIGPFELRSETLAGALQLILADYEIPMAFETDQGLSRTITVTNLRGPLDRVVSKVCGLADLYCAFEDGIMIIKDTQTFTVTVPPVGGDTEIMSALSTGLQAITGVSPIVDEGTRTIIYEATNRTSQLAERYFQRIRSNTALIVYEVYIWEVSLNSSNATGIDWEKIDTFGAFNAGISIPGGTGADFTPISIGLPTKGDVAFGSDQVLQFISEYGAVKTISQPQITMLSGAQATLRAADTINYVSALTRSVDEGEVTVSTETDSVDTGFTLTIGSAWDKATIYGSIDIELQEFRRFQEFDADGTVLQLPETTERELSTQIRIRPGDSLLIAGLVRENDQLDNSGPGFNQPLFSTSREASITNTELVFLLKPRVIVYTDEGETPSHMLNAQSDLEKEKLTKVVSTIKTTLPEDNEIISAPENDDLDLPAVTTVAPSETTIKKSEDLMTPIPERQALQQQAPEKKQEAVTTSSLTYKEVRNKELASTNAHTNKVSTKTNTIDDREQALLDIIKTQPAKTSPAPSSALPAIPLAPQQPEAPVQVQQATNNYKPIYNTSDPKAPTPTTLQPSQASRIQSILPSLKSMETETIATTNTVTKQNSNNTVIGMAPATTTSYIPMPQQGQADYRAMAQQQLSASSQPISLINNMGQDDQVETESVDVITPIPRPQFINDVVSKYIPTAPSLSELQDITPAAGNETLTSGAENNKSSGIPDDLLNPSASW